MVTFPLKTYAQALDYIYSKLPMFQRQGPSAYKKDLTNTLLLSEVAGNPHRGLKTIHIAGTNGKGTTTHIIAGGLQSQGYKVGVYTSPHYKDFRERIKINGIYIPHRFIIKFLNQYHQAIEEIQPSFFEVTVVMAFKYFEAEKVDFAVVETGLGGRLDSTNIITPLLSVITNISFDHQNLLGNTLQEIAQEKAGIIKPKVQVLIGEKQAEISSTFVNKAKVCDAPIYFGHEVIDIQMTKQSSVLVHYDVFANRQLWLHDLQTTLTGPFQDRNILTGLASLHLLSNTIKMDGQKLLDFFPNLVQKTAYIGRWQILGSTPLIIADSAHNEGGLRIVLREVEQLCHHQLHIVLGFVNDKDLNKVLELFPKNAYYYFAKANIPRGLPASDLQSIAKAYGLIGKPYSSVRKAFAAAKSCASQDDLIFVGGSIFVVAEVL